MAIRTFLDANVLIAAYSGELTKREPSLAILNDRARLFIVSPFLYMETMPMPVYHRNAREIDFYRTYFDSAHIWINDVESIVATAQEECERCGIAAMDGMHVAAAHLAGAEVLFTLEAVRKPIHRTSLVRVLSV